jgi:hypothetical protein
MKGTRRARELEKQLIITRTNVLFCCEVMAEILMDGDVYEVHLSNCDPELCIRGSQREIIFCPYCGAEVHASRK